MKLEELNESKTKLGDEFIHTTSGVKVKVISIFGTIFKFKDLETGEEFDVGFDEFYDNYKKVKLKESAREQESIDHGESIDTIIKDEDYYDTAYGMGISFVEDDVKKKYPKLASKILARVNELINQK